MNIRPWLNEDEITFAKILCDTWISFRLSPSYASSIQKAKWYIRQCMLESTHIYVLEIDQQAVGLLMLHDDTQAPVKKDKPSGILKDIRDRYYEQYQRSHNKYRNACLSLANGIGGCNKTIQLLVMNPAYKGKGFGKWLFQYAVQYFYDRNSAQFYLYSDSSCDFTFYEHHGMKQIAKKGLTDGKKQNEFMVYLFKGETETIRRQFI